MASYKKENLMELEKEELVELLLKNESKLEEVKTELQHLRLEVKSNNELHDRIVKLKRESYASQQYLRRDSVESNRLPESITDDQLETIVINILAEIGVKRGS